MRRPRPSPLFVLVALLCWTFVAVAANDRGLFYRAQRDGVEIFLLGSIHVADATLYPLRPAIESAFDTAQVLIVELDPSGVDPERVAAWMAEHGRYPAGDSLEKNLRPQTWRRLSHFLRARNIDPQSVQQQKPGLLLSVLAIQQLSAAGLSAQHGIDEHFLRAARRLDKPVLELETIEDQLTLLAAMPNPDRALSELLDEIDQLKDDTHELLAAWKAGDADQIEPLIMDTLNADDAESQAFYARLLQQRNRAMTARLLMQSEPGTRWFVVVGAAHLLGDEGIPALLRERGFEVERR